MKPNIFPLALADLDLQNVSAEIVTYRGKPALRLVESDKEYEGDAIAILRGSHFKDGVIETEIVGDLRPDAPDAMRGFVGIAFRVQPSQFECFYLRPTNGRADDQLRRNHATQYVSHPDYPWYRLREENPGVYESYTDIVAKEWTRMRIVVANTRAQLYINNAPQPCLIVNDLKLGETSGKIALWIGGGTIAYFADLTVR